MSDLTAEKYNAVLNMVERLEAENVELRRKITSMGKREKEVLAGITGGMTTSDLILQAVAVERETTDALAAALREAIAHGIHTGICSSRKPLPYRDEPCPECDCWISRAEAALTGIPAPPTGKGIHFENEISGYDDSGRAILTPREVKNG